MDFHKKPKRLSELFSSLAEDATESISLDQIIDRFGNRAFAPLLVFFATINLIPVLPPGSTFVLGLPLLFLALQMFRTNDSKVWLPQALLKRSIKAETFRNGMKWIIPKLEYAEKYIGPRYWPFHTQKSGDKIISLIVLIMSISIILPIPGGNWLPALSIALIGVALLERDGILLGIAIFLSFLSILLVSTIIGGLGVFLHWLFNLTK